MSKGQYLSSNYYRRAVKIFCVKCGETCLRKAGHVDKSMGDDLRASCINRSYIIVNASAMTGRLGSVTHLVTGYSAGSCRMCW